MHPGRGIVILLIAGALALSAGCACKRCDQERERITLEWGDPEERTVERTGHLITETWFYWEQNGSVVFLWDDRDCACDVSSYHFEDDDATREVRFNTHSTGPLGL